MDPPLQNMIRNSGVERCWFLSDDTRVRRGIVNSDGEGVNLVSTLRKLGARNARPFTPSPGR